MWTAPCLQDCERRFWIGSLASICPACWVRSHMTAGQDGFRGGSPKHAGDLLSAVGSRGVSPVSDRSIHHLLVLLQGPAFARPRGLPLLVSPIWSGRAL